MSEKGGMPKKVRELMDLHGPGIPHVGFDRQYLVNVYPQPKGPDGRLGSRLRNPPDPYVKYITVVDKKSGRTWGRWAE